MASSTVANFKREYLISLQMLQWERALSRNDREISCFFCFFFFFFFFTNCSPNCGVSLELQRGTQGASSVAPGKSSLHLSCKGERGIALESWQVNWASRRFEGGISRSFLSCGRKPWVPLTCDGDLGELLRVPMGSQECCGFGRGLSGLHWV